MKPTDFLEKSIIQGINIDKNLDVANVIVTATIDRYNKNDFHSGVDTLVLEARKKLMIELCLSSGTTAADFAKVIEKSISTARKALNEEVIAKRCRVDKLERPYTYSRIH